MANHKSAKKRIRRNARRVHEFVLRDATGGAEGEDIKHGCRFVKAVARTISDRLVAGPKLVWHEHKQLERDGNDRQQHNTADYFQKTHHAQPNAPQKFKNDAPGIAHRMDLIPAPGRAAPAGFRRWPA